MICERLQRQEPADLGLSKSLKCTDRQLLGDEMNEHVQFRFEVADAIDTGELAKVKEVFAHHPEQIEAYTPFAGGTWLHYAAGKGFIDIIQYLVGRGLNVNSRSRHDDRTPLTDAANAGHFGAVEYLLEHGAELDTSTSIGNPLFAAISGSVQVNATWGPPTGEAARIVRLLLERGIDSRVRYDSPTMKNVDAIAFAVMAGASELAHIIALWNTNGDEQEAERAISEARSIAMDNTEPVPPGEQYRPS
jgi:hypothetical protein